MTKEEILIKSFLEIDGDYTLENLHIILQEDTIKSKMLNSIIKAMQEYAEIEAVAFAEWKDIYIETYINSDELIPKESKTYSELYKIYKKKNENIRTTN